MGKISSIDVVVIGGYLLVMICIGIWASRRVKNITDYSLAGRKLGYIPMIGTLVGMAIGAASTIGKAGKSYEIGIIFFTATFGYAAGLVLFSFLSKRLREIELWTIPDALKKRYGKGMETTMGAVMLITVVAVFGAQIVGMGVIFSSIGKSYGLTYESAILIAGGIVIFYTMLGGLIAVAYTDLVQTILMIIGIGIILPVMIFHQLPEPANVVEMLTLKEGPLLGTMTPMYLISILIIDCAFCLIDPGLWQRANAAKNGKIISRSMFAASGVYIFWAIVCVFLGAIGSVLIPGIVESHGTTDAVIPALAIKYLPPVLVGLCLVGLLAVMMSTASVVLLISGTTLSNDLYKALKPGTSERGLLIAARVCILIVGIIGIVFALYNKGVFDILLLSFAIYVSGIFVPVIAALYWKRATNTGAVVSTVLSTIVVVTLYALDKPFGIEPIVASLLVSLLTMTVISFITYDPEKATPRLFEKK
ncbi:MAG: sodium:solute symporter family protein [bacterium]|nr:sodium:solute symporter family protein [bacterium]